MFEPVNYGNSFIQGMTGMGDFLLRKQDQDDNRARQVKLDARADEQWAVQKKGSEIAQERDRLAVDREKRQAENEKTLQGYLETSARLKAPGYQPNTDDYKAVMGITEATPYLDNDPTQFPQTKQALVNVGTAMQQIRTLPPGDYIYTRDDGIPEVDNVLGSVTTLLSSNRGKEQYVDNGYVTGVQGKVYKLERTAAGKPVVGGFVVRSGEGDKAGFVAMFPVTDEKGAPIIDPATGKQKMVPSTVGQTNAPDDPVRLISPDEILSKTGFALKVIADAERLGLNNPETLQRVLRGKTAAVMGPDGARLIMEETSPEHKLKVREQTARTEGAEVDLRTKKADEFARVVASQANFNFSGKQSVNDAMKILDNYAETATSPAWQQYRKDPQVRAAVQRHAEDEQRRQTGQVHDERKLKMEEVKAEAQVMLSRAHAAYYNAQGGKIEASAADTGKGVTKLYTDRENVQKEYEDLYVKLRGQALNPEEFKPDADPVLQNHVRRMAEIDAAIRANGFDPRTRTKLKEQASNDMGSSTVPPRPATAPGAAKAPAPAPAGKKAPLSFYDSKGNAAADGRPPLGLPSAADMDKGLALNLPSMTVRPASAAKSDDVVLRNLLSQSGAKQLPDGSVSVYGKKYVVRDGQAVAVQ